MELRRIPSKLGGAEVITLHRITIIVNHEANCPPLCANIMSFPESSVSYWRLARRQTVQLHGMQWIALSKLSLSLAHISLIRIPFSGLSRFMTSKQLAGYYHLERHIYCICSIQSGRVPLGTEENNMDGSSILKITPFSSMFCRRAREATKRRGKVFSVLLLDRSNK